MADPKHATEAKIVHFADFLQAPAGAAARAANDGPDLAPTPGHVLHLAPPERDGLGSAPAPALGIEDPTEPEADLWFAEAAQADPMEAGTMRVPDDVVRLVQELKDARLGLPAAPSPAPVLDDEAEVRLDEVWRPRARFRLVPAATIGASTLALVLSVTALARPTEGPRPAQVTGAAAGLDPDPVAVGGTHGAGPDDEPAVGTTRGATPAPLAASAPKPALDAARAGAEHSSKVPFRRRSQSLRAPSDATHADARFRRAMRNGRAHFERDDFASALTWYRRAARLQQGSADAHYGVALASFERYRDDAARKAIGRALRADAGHAESHLLLGFLLQWSGEAPQAAEHYERYLEAAPEGEFAGEVRAVLASLGR